MNRGRPGGGLWISGKSKARRALHVTADRAVILERFHVTWFVLSNTTFLAQHHILSSSIHTEYYLSRAPDGRDDTIIES